MYFVNIFCVRNMIYHEYYALRTDNEGNNISLLCNTESVSSPTLWIHKNALETVKIFCKTLAWNFNWPKRKRIFEMVKSAIIVL